MYPRKNEMASSEIYVALQNMVCSKAHNYDMYQIFKHTLKVGDSNEALIQKVSGKFLFFFLFQETNFQLKR